MEIFKGSKYIDKRAQEWADEYLEERFAGEDIQAIEDFYEAPLEYLVYERIDKPEGNFMAVCLVVGLIAFLVGYLFLLEDAPSFGAEFWIITFILVMAIIQEVFVSKFSFKWQQKIGLGPYIYPVDFTPQELGTILNDLIVGMEFPDAPKKNISRTSL